MANKINNSDNERTKQKKKNRNSNLDSLKDSKVHYDHSKEFAENYASYSKIAELEKIASYMKKKGYLNGGESTEPKDKDTEDKEGGSGNGKLFGLSDYKGPDVSATQKDSTWIARFGSGGPYKSGIKTMLGNCDKWDDAVLKAAKAEKVDPMLLKIIMLMESGGNANVGASSDGVGSLGMMQITPGNVGVAVDAGRLSEPSYGFEMGAKVCHAKASAAKSNGEPTSVKNVAKRYNGAGPWAELYANTFQEIYEGFPGLKATNDYRTMSGVKKDQKDNSSKGGSTNATGNMKKVIEEAKKHLGGPYIWGGKSPSPGFDCSGLTGWAFEKGMGKNITTYTVTQEAYGSAVSNSDMKMGDLLFWGSVGGSYHVALHIGNNEYIHAPKPGDVVQITKVNDWKPDFTRRPTY